MTGQKAAPGDGDFWGDTLDDLDGRAVAARINGHEIKRSTRDGDVFGCIVCMASASSEAWFRDNACRGPEAEQ